MRFHWQISAGQLFELLFLVALGISVLLSTWVLSNALRRRWKVPAALAWAAGTFFLPPVTLPIYLVSLIFAKRSNNSVENSATPGPRLYLTVSYAFVLLFFAGIYLYRDYQSVDAHLARAAQARLMRNHEKAIREYRAALAKEDDAHTHKLLGIELADAGHLTAALTEFRTAEHGDEPDDLLSSRIADVLHELGRQAESEAEYARFLKGLLCSKDPQEIHCENARTRLRR